MARRQSSLGFLGMFGRSADLRQLDQALRAADLHPALVPEGVKLTLVNVMKDHFPDEPPPEAYPPVAALFAYCVAGPEDFGRANGPHALAGVEVRVEQALDEEDGLDAAIVLLALHAKLANPAVIARFSLSADPS